MIGEIGLIAVSLVAMAHVQEPELVLTHILRMEEQNAKDHSKTLSCVHLATALVRGEKMDMFNL